MNKATPFFWRYLLSLFWVTTLMACSSPSAPGFSPPAAELLPDEVVQIQLSALQNARSDSPEGRSAMAAAYAFASPRNKAAVGDVKAFSQMIRTQYADMIRHSRAIVSTVKQNEVEAAVSVTLLMQSDEPRYYMFLLRKQDSGDCSGCWMTDAVLVLAPDNPAALRAI